MRAARSFSGGRRVGFLPPWHTTSQPTQAQPWSMRLGCRPGSSICRPSILITLRLELDLIVGGRRAGVRLRGIYGHDRFQNARLVGGAHNCKVGTVCVGSYGAGRCTCHEPASWLPLTLGFTGG